MATSLWTQPANCGHINRSKQVTYWRFTARDWLEKHGWLVIALDEDKENRYFNIPIANTTVTLLGIGIETWDRERMKVQSQLMRQVNDDS